MVSLRKLIFKRLDVMADRIKILINGRCDLARDLSTEKSKKVEGVDNEITGNSLKARSRGKRIDRACFLRFLIL